ncbi:40S ribosomal protein S4 [Echria macrotheca]|uniref:40S ribosomal protein S4 n=1 Tax=Echria macrotheca TaxID=438768 RepID=A0AAJ0BIN8_9PEZI|nr:40S ribosomal protein S4 [Echria macrotheca]
MATIEPRLIHLLNEAQTPDLPPLQLSSVEQNSNYISLPPIEPDPTYRADHAVPPTQIPPLLSIADDALTKQPSRGADNVFPIDPPARAVKAVPSFQELLDEIEPSTSSLPLRRLVDNTPDFQDDLSTKKRHRGATQKDDFMQLPQPLKKQKSTQQVVPPIIAGLHEPPPDPRVFPPINTDGPALFEDYCNIDEDRNIGVLGANASDSGDKTSGTAKGKRRATKPRKKWSDEETNHLLLGVSRYGVGKWTSILEDKDFKFNGRTAGDLKDRFRTCCPDELRGPSTGPGRRQRLPKPSKTGVPLERLLIEPPSTTTTASGTPARAHRKKMEDLAELGIHAPFKKSHRRERRPFTEEDDKFILDGLKEYGPAWTKIQRDAKFNLLSRQPTDLRDRVRNKYPEIYASIEKGTPLFAIPGGSLLEPLVKTTIDAGLKQHNLRFPLNHDFTPSSRIPINHLGTQVTTRLHTTEISQSLTHHHRKKHQKRLSAPSHWLLDKLSGVYAPRPSAGPHKLRDCMPLIVFVRNRLKYALNYRETRAILMQRLVKVDGKVRTDMTYPAGFMDVITIEKTGENFRLIYDTKGRFTVHRIQEEEAKYKLGKVKRVQLGRGGIPFLVTHDARTIRYPDPLIKVNDTVKIDLETGKIQDFIRFDTGAIAMVTGGRNMGRVGVITHRERHDGGFAIVHLKDAIDNTFATRETNVFVIGQEKPWVSLPKGKGVKLTIAEERDRRRAQTLAH